MGAISFTTTLLPGALTILAEHQREMPQKNELCGAFWITLALRGLDGRSVEQDTVGLAASSLLSVIQSSDSLPPGEPGRSDYVLDLTRTDDPDIDSGTSSEGLMVAATDLSAGRLLAIPASGHWTGKRIKALLEGVAGLKNEVLVIANSATRFLWGTGGGPLPAIEYLTTGATAQPTADWNVGHFIGVLGWISGPSGELLVCADTYPSLGSHGVHLQPFNAMADSLNRDDSPFCGGMLLVVPATAQSRVREIISGVGLTAEVWDNGTPYRPDWVPAG
ncbi:MAG: hypothetical protein O2943_06405 [Actinomycetota bacterium]|nr:hypothetical protein [Chloroflexota bacterium]MDA3022279.1 hypothetical protein [Actinomycetota bacterium]